MTTTKHLQDTVRCVSSHILFDMKGVLTFPIGAIKPMGTLITKMSHLRLAINLHALVVCLHKGIEVIVLISNVLYNEALLPFFDIFK